LFLQEKNRVIARRRSFRWKLHKWGKMALEIRPLEMTMVLVLMMIIHKRSKSSVLRKAD